MQGWLFFTWVRMQVFFTLVRMQVGQASAGTVGVWPLPPGQPGIMTRPRVAVTCT